MYERDQMLMQYMRDIKQYPLITPEREQELANTIHDKKATPEDRQKAKQELILSNLRIVLKIALETYNRMRSYNDTNISLMDLVQAGNIGLMRAVDLFLSGKDNKFVTYAHLSIQRKIMVTVKESRFIRLPPNYFKYMRDIDEIEKKHGEMNDKDLAKKLDIMIETLRIIKRNRFTKVAVEDLEDFLSAHESGDIPLLETLNKNSVKNYVFEKMKELKPRHRQVLFYRFFSNSNMTLEDVGNKLGITREAVRRIEAAAMHKIRIKIGEEKMFGKVGMNKMNKKTKGGKK